MAAANTATASDFDKVAQSQANSFWFWAIVAGVVGYFWHWWAIIPGLLAVLKIANSVMATRCATQLRNGSYPFPNPNNGAPDGDAKNRQQAPQPSQNP